MNEEQNNKNIIQMLYYIIKTYDTGLSKEDIDSLDIIQQENTQLRQQLKETNNCLELQISNVTLLEKELKDKDEKISKAIEYILENTYEQIEYLDNVSQYYDRKLNNILKILESNKED